MPTILRSEKRDGRDEPDDRSGTIPSSTKTTSARQSLDQRHSRSETATPDLSLKEDKAARDKERRRKGVSFLSRIIGNRNRNSGQFGSVPGTGGGPMLDQPDSGEVQGLREAQEAESRPEGMNVCPFSGRQAPQYVKVRVKNRPTRELSHLFLAQRLEVPAGDTDRSADDNTTATSSPTATTTSFATNAVGTRKDSGKAVWAMRLSLDGRYLAAGYQDGHVRVWQVISTPRERRMVSDGQGSLSAAVFHPEPVQVFVAGRQASVLDVSWSKNNFLLSSSSDKTVRLWHVSRNECLCMFRHSEIIPSVSFHPLDDRFFLAASLDAKVRLWSITDRNVAFWAQLPAMVTAVAFSPDGSMAVAGTGTGVCVFFETKGMREVLRYVVRSSRGRNSRGSRITSIATQWADESDELEANDGVATGPRPFDVLIASNDSRIRLYRMRPSGDIWTIGLEKKFKGHAGQETQLRASFGADGRYVVCGSEDRRSFIWQLGSGLNPGCRARVADAGRPDPVPHLSRLGSPDPDGQAGQDEPVAQTLEYSKHPVEIFEASGAQTTAVVLAPESTRRLMAASGDTIYELCSRSALLDLATASLPGTSNIDGVAHALDEASTVFSAPNFANSITISRHGSVASQGSGPPPESRGSEQASTRPRPESIVSLSEAIDNYHSAGHVILSADAAGSIAVFRQDCAHAGRSGGPVSDLLMSQFCSSYPSSLAGRNSVFPARGVPSIRSYFSTASRDREASDDKEMTATLPALAALRNRPVRSGSTRTIQGSGQSSRCSTGRSTPVLGPTRAVTMCVGNTFPRQSRSTQHLVKSGLVPTNIAGPADKHHDNSAANLHQGLDNVGHIPVSLVRSSGEVDQGLDGAGVDAEEAEDGPQPATVATPAQSFASPSVAPRQDRILSWRSQVGSVRRCISGQTDQSGRLARIPDGSLADVWRPTGPLGHPRPSRRRNRSKAGGGHFYIRRRLAAVSLFRLWHADGGDGYIIKHISLAPPPFSRAPHTPTATFHHPVSIQEIAAGFCPCSQIMHLNLNFIQKGACRHHLNPGSERRVFAPVDTVATASPGRVWHACSIVPLTTTDESLPSLQIPVDDSKISVAVNQDGEIVFKFPANADVAELVTKTVDGCLDRVAKLDLSSQLLPPPMFRHEHVDGFDANLACYSADDVFQSPFNLPRSADIPRTNTAATRMLLWDLEFLTCVQSVAQLHVSADGTFSSSCFMEFPGPTASDAGCEVGEGCLCSAHSTGYLRLENFFVTRAYLIETLRLALVRYCTKDVGDQREFTIRQHKWQWLCNHNFGLQSLAVQAGHSEEPEYRALPVLGEYLAPLPSRYNDSPESSSRRFKIPKLPPTFPFSLNISSIGTTTLPPDNPIPQQPTWIVTRRNNPVGIVLPSIFIFLFLLSAVMCT